MKNLPYIQYKKLIDSPTLTEHALSLEQLAMHIASVHQLGYIAIKVHLTFAHLKAFNK